MQENKQRERLIWVVTVRYIEQTAERLLFEPVQSGRGVTIKRMSGRDFESARFPAAVRL